MAQCFLGLAQCFGLALCLQAAACGAGLRPSGGELGPRPSLRPNIVLFLVDDLGWQDLSVPLHEGATALNRRYRTPNVERLAREGVAFTNAYAAAPVCTPTRVSIMTGQDPARLGITYWTLHKDTDSSTEHASLRPPAWRVNGLTAEQSTLASRLASAGYHTIHVGKAHFGAHGTSGQDPLALGFEQNIAGHASGAPASYYGEHNFSQAGRLGQAAGEASVWDVPGLEKYHGQAIHLTEALSREALPAMAAAHASGKPFFLNFCTYAVHTPIMANPRLLAPYAELDPREAAYATLVESYDNALGALLGELDRLGIAEDTLVLFASDNGGLSAHARGGLPHVHNAPLRSGKGSAYEGGTRVPSFVRWPAVARSGARVHTPIISADIFVTLLAAAGVPPHSLRPEPVDGQDLLPLLQGQGSRFSPRTLGWHQPHQWGATGPGIEPFSSIRQGSWKLIWFHARADFELYDLASDIGEQRDLAAAEPGRVQELAKLMQAWLDERGAQHSIQRSSGLPVVGPARLALALR